MPDKARELTIFCEELDKEYSKLQDKIRRTQPQFYYSLNGVVETVCELRKDLNATINGMRSLIEAIQKYINTETDDSGND